MNQWAGTEAQRRAEVLGKTRLTDAQVSEIEERWVAGETLISLSKRWSREFGPFVKVDRLKRKMIHDDEEKEPFCGFQGARCA